MELDEALAADKLWGWPVDVLDQLADLRKRAWRDELSLEEWREQDAARRSGLPAVDTKEVQALYVGWLMDGSLDTEAGGQLGQRLTALTTGAPSDEDLWQSFERLTEDLDDRRRDRQLNKTFLKHRDRIVAWLTRPGGGVDPATGLPWSQIVHHRVVDDPELGSVPQYIGSARQVALRGLSDEARQRADLIRDKSSAYDLGTAIADLQQERLTWLPRRLQEAAAGGDDEVRQLSRDLLRIWAHPKVQDLLMAETSQGWHESGVEAPASDG